MKSRCGERVVAQVAPAERQVSDQFRGARDGERDLLEGSGVVHVQAGVQWYCSCFVLTAVPLEVSWRNPHCELSQQSDEQQREGRGGRKEREGERDPH